MGSKNSIVLAAIALIAIFAFKYMQKQMVPYVSYAEAMSKAEYVQIIGKIDRVKGITAGKDGLRFTLVDKNSSIDVKYDGESPKNIDSAERIVAIGIYDKNARMFIADSILTKCPSKYQNRAVN